MHTGIRDHKIIRILDEVLRSQDFLAAEFDTFNKQLTNIREEHHEVISRLDKLDQMIDSHEEKIVDLNTRLNYFEQQRLSRHMNIIGIPKNLIIDPRQFLKAIGNVLRCPISDNDIRNINQTQPNQRNGLTSILVIFSNFAIKQKLMTRQRENGPIQLNHIIANLLPQQSHGIQLHDQIQSGNL